MMWEGEYQSHVNVDVQVYVVHAGLRLPMLAAFMPRALTHLGVLDLRKLETLPDTAWRQS